MLLLALACSSGETFVCRLIGRRLMLRLCTPCMHHDRGVHIHKSSDADLGHCQQSASESHTIENNKQDSNTKGFHQ